MKNKVEVEHYELYDGEIQLDYWPKSHKYVIDDDRKIGVTTVTGVINKEALMTWPLNEAVAYLNNVASDVENGIKNGDLTVIGYKQLREEIDNASKAYLKKQLRGTDAGTLGHEWLERFLRAVKNDTEIPDKLQKLLNLDYTDESSDEYIRVADHNNMVDSIDSFIDWMRTHDVEVLDVEKIIYSREYDYCGRFDAILKIDGKVYIVDFKTSNPSRDFPEGIYPENFAQMGGYDIGYTEEFPDFHIDGHAIFNLSKKKKSLYISYSDERDLNRDFFLSTLGVKRGMQFHTNRLKFQDKKPKITKGEQSE